MLDNGYSLSRVELLNWGNFHGYQKFSLFERGADGPLFSPPPASVILGVNGSGKSTLIDALMIALLPFEGSVKLGVTNDIEGGSGGGRTIRDYVLGKHSSSGGMNAAPESIFGRKSGCTLLVLNFQHNRIPNRNLTIGRGWWYQNYKVSETQVAFLAFEKLALQEICPGGQSPTTAKIFRQHLKESRAGIQVFETMQTYFGAVSEALGRISRDDLKILNRAFFVKSISNIDQFIRDNMLVEQESPSLERLMDNVRNGNEIAFSIEICEAKIAAIERILRELVKLREKVLGSREIDRAVRTLSVFREWCELRKLIDEKETLAKEVYDIDRRLPLARREASDAAEKLLGAQSRLRDDDVESRLRAVEHELKMVQEKIGWQKATLDRWKSQAQELAIRWPSSPEAWLKFVADIEVKMTTARMDIVRVQGEIESLRESKFALDVDVREVREQLEHVSKNRTLIPRELHLVRDRALSALKIPGNHLMFVGELLQVKREFQDNRRAVESVLFPIARNLLCHPDSLNDFTRWLDAEGLKADVTAKRISSEELDSFAQDRALTEFSGQSASVLSMIEMRPAADHPFSTYLWRWLGDSFDYRLTDVKRFRSEAGRLVTRDGLTKKDERTMRKLKQQIANSLGWDNTDAIEDLTRQLLDLNRRHGQIIKKIEALQKTQSLEETRLRFFIQAKDGYNDVAGIQSDMDRSEQIEKVRQKLLIENPDHHALRKEVAELEVKAKGLQRGLLSLETNCDGAKNRLTKIDALIPSRERDLYDSTIYLRLVEELSSKEKLEESLISLREKLASRGVSQFQYESELQDEARKNDRIQKEIISTLAMTLGNYRHKFNDPNLPYDLGSDPSNADRFLSEWGNAEKRLRETELPGVQEKWRHFFDRVLLDSVKDTINEIKKRIHESEDTIRSINEVLKLTNFEDLADEQRYLRIEAKTSDDERVRKFRKSMSEVEKTLSPVMRLQIETQSQSIMSVLVPFVDEFQKDPGYRAFVTDVRNHFQFSVQSLRRETLGPDVVVETFEGARKDAKSSAQTTQLAYALLASCLAFRFKFHDPVAGRDTPRIIILDEFGGKFDNEKPREILKLLDKMGFQSILVSPMSKADLLADSINQLVFVHKASASKSKVQSYQISSREDYERLLASAVEVPG
jgi:uncharacterized protein YPO0396